MKFTWRQNLRLLYVIFLVNFWWPLKEKLGWPRDEK